jgi:hypothetical protein
MTWNECKNFGVVEIVPGNNTLKLYYNQWSFCLAGNPIFLNITDAFWQGNNLILRGYNTSNRQPLIYIMDGFNSYRPIF